MAHEEEEEEEEEEFFNHYKNDLKRHAHTPSGVAGAERASSTLLKVVTFASRSFSTFFAIFSSLRPT